MLRDSFYHINSANIVANTVVSEIRFNTDHAIFQGHFPGQPVVPGVCMMQIVKDFAEDIVEFKLTLKEGDNIKFLSVIDPNVNNVVQVAVKTKIDGDHVSATASLSNEQQIFFKFEGTYSR
jgi:3-hydroxyacyl-[acyl-carrier-protein] dehydratase